MKDYIPRSDPDRILWMTNFARWLTANGASRGFTPGQIDALNAAVGDATAALVRHNVQRNAARAATAAKNTAMTTALDLSRQSAQRVQDHPDTSDEDRGAAGLTVRDTTPTVHADSAAGAVQTLPPPQLILDFSIRRQVAVHWGVNPANEHENARPAGVIGCEIQYARGGIPEDEAQWVRLDNITESPLVHITHDAAPITHAYRARYIGKNLKFGSYSAPAVCTVSV